MTPPRGLMDRFSIGGIPGVRAIATALPTSTVAMRLLAGLSSKGRWGSPKRILSMAVTRRFRSICGASSRTCSQARSALEFAVTFLLAMQPRRSCHSQQLRWHPQIENL